MIVSTDIYEPITAEQADTLRKTWPDADRLNVAFRLASDVETCADLLAGRKVDPARLDPAGLEWAKQTRFVQLASPLDAIEVAA